MNQSMRELEETLRDRFCDADQGHVFRFWDDLSDRERKVFLEQLSKVDLDLLKRLLDEHLAPSKDSVRGTVEPPPVIPLPSSDEERARDAEAREAGDALLRAGEVAVVLVAGGQATRLGFNGPKGLFPIGPISGKSLFEIHAEKVRATGVRYGTALPVYIMTSAANDAATRQAFEEADYFGLDPGNVMFFQQEMLPAVNRSGLLILAECGRLSMSPDGHGGCLRALQRSGAVKQMRERGVTQLFYFQVDNPLVRVADPSFMGYHTQRGAEMSLKVVRKRNAQEKVGVVALIDGHLGVIEYSDLGEELSEARHADGRLRFDAGSIAIHAFSLEFVERLTAGGDLRLPFHKAHKIIETVDDKGHPRWPEEPNGIKFEAFIFDALPMAGRAVVMEVSREDEFSPVKNADGLDSPETCKRDMANLYRRWLEAAGLGTEDPNAWVEISPLFALDEEELIEKVGRRRVLASRCLLVQ